MREQAYQLCGEQGSVVVLAADLANLALVVGDSIGERDLRRRADQLANRSLAGAIHAMLDQEESRVIIVVQPWPARQA
jgi:hypothetical protein